MWKLNKFCCCFNIRTGSLIIGIIETILATLYLVVSFGNINILHYASVREKISDRELNMALVFTYSMYYHFGCALISSVIHGMSIYGIHKKKRIYILPYLVMNGLVLGILLAAAVIGLVWGSISQNGDIIVMVIVLCIVCGGIKAYFWTTIYFYYKEVVAQKTNRHSHLSTDSAEDANAYTISPQKLI